MQSRGYFLSSLGGSSKILSVTTFDCYSPPPANTVRGALVPRALDVRRRRRRISIEVHLVDGNLHEAPSDKKNDAFYEECIVRIMDPEKTMESISPFRKAKFWGKTQQHVSDDSQSVAVDNDIDDGSTADFIDPDLPGLEQPDVHKGWKTKYRCPLSNVTVKGSQKSTVTIEVSLASRREIRELIFDTVGEAEEFCAVFQREHALQEIRAQKKIETTVGSNVAIDADEKMTFLIEVVSGWNLPVGDLNSSDPYVSVYLNGKKIHKTKHISNALDPVWTVADDSLFLLQVDFKTLFQGDGLHFVLKDFDSLGQDEVLGTVIVSGKVLLGAQGERMEYKLQPPIGTKGDVSGHIAIRCRRASEYDINFMENLNKPEDKHDTFGLKLLEKHALPKGGSNAVTSVMNRKHRVSKHGKNFGKKEYKVRPNPDPARPDETTWMCKEDIEQECMKESLNWIESGSGELGRLHVEILKCDDLPQMDLGGFAGNKTDPFVSIVYEDTLARTDTIDDCFSPRWLPWTKRAFIFPMLHSSSDLLIGVFDYDLDAHDLVGRISIELSNLWKNTVYTLCYDLYTSSKLSNPPGKSQEYRKKAGTITIRLRIEIEDERKLVLSNLTVPPTMYVNVQTKKDFKVVRATCAGKHNLDAFDINIIYSYRDELFELRYGLLLLLDAVTAILLWHGTLEVEVGNKSFFLPVHSLTAFLMATTLVERPGLLPSYFFASFAWIMMSAVDFRRRNSGPWNSCKTFRELSESLILGESTTPHDNIRPNERHAEMLARLDAWEKRKNDFDAAIAKMYKDYMEADEEYRKEMEEVADVDTDISTKQGGGFSVDPRNALLKLVLFPLQQNLSIIISFARNLKNIVTWQECYISFWLTVGSLAVSLICFFIPWLFIFTWVARIFVWAVFGPWMKLIDVFYLSRIKRPSTAEEVNKLRLAKEKRLIQNRDAVRKARIARENTVKLKAMKKLLFGQYVYRVPILKEERFIDVPRPESCAAPYKSAQRTLSELAMMDAGYHKIKVPGQHLVGDMIPKIASENVTDAPVGQATSRLQLIDTEGPGGAVLSGNDSTASAYAKIGALVFTAGVLTWFGVPLLASLTQYSLRWAQSS